MLVYISVSLLSRHFFFNDTATTEIYTLSLHDALPIFTHTHTHTHTQQWCLLRCLLSAGRSEEHTSELQSHLNLVCRLLLEKIKTILNYDVYSDRPALHMTYILSLDCV